MRDPTYLKVLAAIAGQSLVLGRPVLLIYAAAAFGAFIRWHEETDYGQALRNVV